VFSKTVQTENQRRSMICNVLLVRHHHRSLIPLSGVGSICFLLSFSSITRHLHAHSFYFHAILHTVHPSFPRPTFTRVTIYIHTRFGAVDWKLAYCAQEVAGSIPAQYKHFVCMNKSVLGLGIFCGRYEIIINNLFSFFLTVDTIVKYKHVCSFLYLLP
jgi:hypothetical protein